MLHFPHPLKIPFTHPLNGQTYYLVSCDQIAPTPEQLQRIVTICNEPAVYEWLFHHLLDGRPYPVEMAMDWLSWSAEGWQQGTHFSFAVTDDTGAIAAACDIKSATHVDAEIGYWCSAEHRGLMTTAVKLMCQEAKRAGFRSLTARTRLGNTRSQAVLLRAGFTEKILPDDAADAYYAMALQSTEASPQAS